MRLSPGAWRLLLAGALLSAPPLTAATGRAVWVWEPEAHAMLNDPRAAGEAVDFLREKRITRVYLYADSHQDRRLDGLRRDLYGPMIRRLREQGISAYALLGSPYLRTERYVLPEYRDEALAMLRRVLDYNAQAPPPERFDGVNLDIEPHQMDEWDEHKHRLLRQFLELGEAFMDLKAVLRSDLAIGPAIPFWLDQIELEWRGQHKPASAHVLDVFDYAALMDYRNRAGGPDGIIALGLAELTQAAQRGKQLVVGVELSPHQLSKVSFNGLNESAFERELATAERAFRESPAFGGFVIHDLQAYRDWIHYHEWRRRPVIP